MPSLRSSAIAGAVVAVAVAAVLFPSAPGAELTTSWLKLTALDRAAWMLFMVCGMHGSDGDGTSIFGGPWRQCFEGVTFSINGRAAAGDWDGVLSEDVRFEAPALGSSPARELTVRVYRGSDGRYDSAHPEQRPVLLWLHGGGFTIEHTYSRDYDLACRALAAEGGWVVVSVEYRLAPEHPFPAALHDAYAALSWLAATAAPGPSRPQPLASADLARLAVGGDSAGGNLAAVLAVLARDKLDPEVTPPLPLLLPLTLSLTLTLTPSDLNPNPNTDPNTNPAPSPNPHQGQPAAVELPVRHQLLVYPVLFPPGGATESRRRLRHTALFIGAGANDFFTSSYFGQYQPASQYQPADDIGHHLDYLDGLLWVRTDPRASPFAAANGHAGLAPATVILAEVDPLRDEGRQYVTALRAAAVPTHVLEYRMPHGFFILGHALALPEAAAAMREAAHAVNQGLRRADP